MIDPGRGAAPTDAGAAAPPTEWPRAPPPSAHHPAPHPRRHFPPTAPRALSPTVPAPADYPGRHVRDRLIDGLIQGDRLAWAVIGVVWALTAVVVLLHRPGPGGARGSGWTWLLLAAATGTSLVGLPLSAAISVPRVRWATVDAPDLVAASGESWRRLRGPAVLVSGPDIAVPTVDATDHWVLFGLLSGKAVPGLPAAEPAPMPPGAARLCLPAGEACRPWPVAWPDPARPVALGELTWSRGEGDGASVRVAGALAYDVETGLYLRHVDPAPGTAADAPQLELVGRVAGDAPRESESVLFVVREVKGTRLKAVRVVATPAHDGGGHAFHLQRAEVSLAAGPRVFAWGVRPLLALISLALPLGVMALLLAPVLRRPRWVGASGPVSIGGGAATRREAGVWIVPYLEAIAAQAAGLAAAAPAGVAHALWWGAR